MNSPVRLSPKQRLDLVERVLKDKVSVTDACRAFQVSRFTFYKWFKRYKETEKKDDLTSLSDRQPVGKTHWRRTKAKIEQEALRLIKQHPNYSINQYQQLFSQLSHHGWQNLLERFDLKTKADRSLFQQSISKRRELSLEEKQELIDWLKSGESISHICLKFQISRFTFYKWLKRYQQATEPEINLALSSRRPHGEHHWRTIKTEDQKKILDLIIKDPRLSTHRIAQMLTSIGNHGVQNVLRRLNLNTYEKRLIYVQSLATRPIIQPTPAVSLPSVLAKELTPQLMPAPPPSWKSLRRPFFFSFLASIIIFNLSAAWLNLLGHYSFSQQIGLSFASVALLIGGLFFAYSMKYYFSLALVLSFTRQANDNNTINNSGGFSNWLKRVFGISLSLSISKLSQSSTIASGLQSSLDLVKINRYPFFSIHLPLYNEKKVVERLLKACTSFEYPSYEIIVCDDSTDETSQIVNDFAIEFNQSHPEGPHIKVFHRSTREGFKGGALSYALKKMNPATEFVCVFDADFVPYPDTLMQFLKYFKSTGGWSEEKNYQANQITTIPYDTFNPVVISNPDQYTINRQLITINQQSKVAAVAGYQWHVLNKSENWITRGVRTEYAGSYVVERPAQEILNALKIIHGSVYCIRADVLKHFGWGTSITEDYELTLRLYAQGFKVVYTPYIQAPSECVSTLKRLIRQRMRWAEGHSFNTKKQFKHLIFNNDKLTFSEKLEFLYLAPYYLQAFFFLIGTFSWLISEAIFKVRLPFWTSLWGWSLVLTNLLALPMVNSVGLFLEESDKKDYLGIFSFIVLCYLVVPFQAYAAIKGFLEPKEGPWFRTPKSGLITDIFTPGRFYRWVGGIFTQKKHTFTPKASYLYLRSANNQFSGFRVTRRSRRWLGKFVLSSLLIISMLTSSLAGLIKEGTKPQEVMAFDMIKGASDTNKKSITLRVINRHTHPKAGENWTVSFVTEGKADLLIKPADQTTIDDLEPVKVECGLRIMKFAVIENDALLLKNWRCNQEARVVHYVKRAGNHQLDFQFNQMVDTAYNSPWWNLSWSYRFKYEIPNANLPDGEALTDFPLHIDLADAPSTFWASVQEDGDDIRVIDSNDSTQLVCHLEDWNSWATSKSGQLWCKKSIAQDTGSNTDFVYVYYGNAGASSDWNRANTYNSNFKGYWDLSQGPGGQVFAYLGGAHYQREIDAAKLYFLGARATTSGVWPYFSQGSNLISDAVLGDNEYDSMMYQSVGSLLGDGSEATVRNNTRTAIADWKTNHLWGLYANHNANKVSVDQLGWILDEVTSDGGVWIGTYSQALEYLQSNTTPPPGYDAMFTWTVDDGREWGSGFGTWGYWKTFRKYGVRPTLFLSYSQIDSANGISTAEIKELNRMGFEIGVHAYEEGIYISDDAFKIQYTGAAATCTMTINTTTKQVIINSSNDSEDRTYDISDTGYMYMHDLVAVMDAETFLTVSNDRTDLETPYEECDRLDTASMANIKTQYQATTTEGKTENEMKMNMMKEKEIVKTITGAFDNTSNTSDLFWYDYMNPGDLVSGVSGNGLNFNGSSQYLETRPATESASLNQDANIKLVGTASTSENTLGQGIKIGSTVNIDTVRLWLKRTGTFTNADLTVEIQTDNSGVPSGTPVTNGTSNETAVSSIGTSYGWIDFSFSTHPSLTANTQYHLVLKGNADYTSEYNSTTTYIQLGVDQTLPSYTGGVFSKGTDDASWTVYSPATDAVFEVHYDKLSLTSALSVGAWIKPTVVNSSDEDFIVGKRTAGTSANGYGLFQKEDDIYFRINGADVAQATGVLTAGQWHSVVGTFDGTTAKVYVNGTVGATTDTGSVSDVSTIFKIGSDASQYFNGVVDATFVANLALSAEWVQFWNLSEKGDAGTVLAEEMTSSSAQATAYSFQRKTWFDGSRLWSAFYSGSEVEFWYSEDGSTWTRNGSATTSISSSDFSIEADSAYVFMAYTDGYDVKTASASASTNYPGSDFSWNSSVTTYDGASTSDQYYYPAIKRDSNNKIRANATKKYTTSDTKYESFETTADGTRAIWGANWIAQNFTPSSGHTVTKITINVQRQSGTTDSLTCGIQGTTSSKPNGTDLTTGTVAYTAVGTSASWVDIDVTDYALSASTLYSIVCRCPSCASATYDYLWSSVTAGGYANGNDLSSTDSGVNWTTRTRDLLFQEWQEGSTTYSTQSKLTTQANDVAEWGSAATINSSSNSNQYGSLVPLNSGDMYAVFIDGTALKGCFYDEQTSDRWEDSAGASCEAGAAQDSLDTGVSGLTKNMSLVSDTTTNDLHLTYIEDDTTDTVSYKRWDNGTGTNGTWQSEITLDSSDNDANTSLSIDTATDDLYALWMDTTANKIYYRVCDKSAAGSECSNVADWAAEVEWKSTTSGNYVNSNYSGDGRIFAQWQEGASSPYSIKWDYLIPENLWYCLAPGLLILIRRKRKKSLLTNL